MIRIQKTTPKNTMKKSTGILYGIGVGPGDPELLTLKGAGILQEADLVVYPQTAPRRDSVALEIARSHLKKGCLVLPMVFPMIRDQSLLEKSWAEGAARICRYLDRGFRIAFLTLGDPMLYSTYIYIFRRIRRAGFPVKTIPGITSFCAAAAAADMPLCEGDEKVAIIPWNPAQAVPKDALQHFDSLVMLKISTAYPSVLDYLKEEGFAENSVLVEKCGHRDQQITFGGDIPRDLSRRPGRSFDDVSNIVSDNDFDNKSGRSDGGIPYLSLIIAKKDKKSGKT